MDELVPRQTTTQTSPKKLLQRPEKIRKVADKYIYIYTCIYLYVCMIHYMNQMERGMNKKK